MRKCRLCQGKKFKKVLNMGDNPLVNSLIEKKDLDKKEKTYPLVVEQCQNCSLVQIVEPISTHEIYQKQDYLYLSSDMPKLDEYFKKLANELCEYIDNYKDLVVEIGSNDGILLKQLYGCRILGVDPSTNVVVRALSDNIPTLSAGFTERVARNIKQYYGKAKIIGGANCIAHIDDLHDLMRGVKFLLKDDGVFWVECNYWGGMVENVNYSLIYHDHFSYFSLQNWVDILKDYDMEVFDATVTPAQGGSLRLFAGFINKHLATQRYLQLFREERDNNLASYQTCLRYQTMVKKEAENLHNVIDKIKKEGKTIAGYGAAAKGFSVLKLAKITEKHIDYFVDDSPAKQNKYTPITHIPVISRKSATKRGLPDYFFITAPNYEDVIVEKEQDFLKAGGKFITVDGRIIEGEKPKE